MAYQTAPGALDGFHDLDAGLDVFRGEVLDGLAASPKRLPPKYFYDAEGSRLFDAICGLEEYYPTRTETALLAARADEIAGLVGANTCLVEFGSGSSVKTRILLDALPSPAAYIPVDISRSHLLASARALAAAYPDVPVTPVCADYTGPFDLPDAARGKTHTGFFPGSSIGNFRPADAVAFLRQAAEGLGRGSGMIVGVDLKKDAAILHAAYDDSLGVTAAFNRNLLVRINRELRGDADIKGFAHEARYNAERGCIEMHLVSRRDQTVTVAGHAFDFTAGESIHTEDSFKYTVPEFQALATQAGWTPAHAWTDPDELFSVHYLIAG